MKTPEEWHNSITIPIFKKGQKNLPTELEGNNPLKYSETIHQHHPQGQTGNENQEC